MIEQIIEQIVDASLGIIQSLGYMGIFLAMALESAGILIPSEVIMPFSGFLASQGHFNFWLIVAVGTVANLVGSLILYFISKSGGRWLLEKYGKYVLISKDEIDKGDKWFKKYGIKAVFFGRIIPVVRTFISLPAGVAKVNLLKFAIFTILGSLPWNFALTYAGYKAGENWDFLGSYFRKFDILIVAIVVILIVLFIRSRLRKKA